MRSSRYASSATLAVIVTVISAACGGAGEVEAPGGADGARGDDAPAPAAGIVDPNGVGVVPLAPCSSDPLRIREFSECAEGGGIFGRWIVDGHGLPAFSYELDQRSDPRASWPNSEDIFPVQRERRDHFHVTGNQRVNVVAVDDGYVTLFGNERGPTYLNRFAEEQRNLGGGFSYVKDGADVYATAYRYAPPAARTRRVIGMSYYDTESEVGGLRVRHVVHAPFGDHPFVLDDVEIANTSAHDKHVAHYEYWDVNRHQLLTEWVRTGLAAGPSDRGRDGLNGAFTQTVAFDPLRKVLTATMAPKGARPAASQISAVDHHPPPIFLACLSGTVDAVYTDQDRFFGDDLRKPAAVTGALPGDLLTDADAAGQPATLVMRSDLVIAAGATRRLRFAYGYAPEGKSSAETASFRAAADPLGDTLGQWKNKLAYVSVPGERTMHRETAWRTQLLQAHTVRNDYYGASYTAQGSAYLYLHGADGVPRDQALFAAATTYLDPAIAKGNLRLVMGVTDATTGQKAYSFTGYGINEGATLHTTPSDLDIFFLYGLAEYLSATGDAAFLEESVDFHPRSSAALPPGAAGRTVLDHVRVAFRHLRDAVGRGSHGLVRMLDGDWSDGIVFEDLSPTAIAFTAKNGESVPNTQMALVALPLAADAIGGRDSSLASEMRAYAQGLKGAVTASFGSRWFTRAWVSNSLGQSYAKGNDQPSDGYHANFIDLEAQPWGVLSGVLDPAKTTRVLDEVESRLDALSPIGPMMREGGMVWPAISQLMTWAYARHRPASAWRSLGEQLYATHATQWPGQWAGILSAPDGLNAAPGSDGGAWASPVTPMTDFPVANMNPEAMWLLGVLRTAGVEPAAGGLLIAPRGATGRETYTVDVPLLRLDVSPGVVRGLYRAKNDGHLELTVVVDRARVHAKLRGAVVSAPASGGRVVLPLTFRAGEEIAFEVTGD